jgi:trk system potassium uptake protein TrkA
MYIVIVGGGKVGYYLSKTLLSYKHKVMIIDLNKDLCSKIADELFIPVLTGDATKINILEAADTAKANIFIAVTGQDEENLIACQLAKKNFGVKRTIARVNNPKNIKVFEALGVDAAVSSTSIISDLIEQEVDYVGMQALTTIHSDLLVINEIEIRKNSPVHDKLIGDLDIPDGCVLVSIIKRNEVMMPKDSTLLRAGDSVIIISAHEDRKILRDIFIGSSL